MRGSNKTIPPETRRKSTKMSSFSTRLRRCRLKTMMSRPTTTMPCRMLLSAPRLTQTTWNRRRPRLASRRLGSAPPRPQSPPSAPRPAGATRRGTPTSRGRVPMTSTAPPQVLLATARRVSTPSAFQPRGLSAHWHPTAGRSVRPSGMPPRRRCWGTTMSRGWAPTSSLPLKQLLSATARRATAPSVFRPRDGSAHRRRLSDRLARSTGAMPLCRSR